MDFNNLVPSRRQYDATHSASDFVGVSGGGEVSALSPNTPAGDSASTNFDALGERLLDERTRIAQELHDTLLQGFLAVSMQLHAAVDHLPADCPSRPLFSDVLQMSSKTTS
jgi:signal transduction histidine kinase